MGVVSMRWDWPVDVNYHEARAYCFWKTEQDWALVKYRCEGVGMGGGGGGDGQVQVRATEAWG